MAGLLCLLAVGCSPAATEEASLPAQSQVELQVETPLEGDGTVPADGASIEAPIEEVPALPGDASNNDATSSESVGSERGGRVGADEPFLSDPASTAPPTPSPVPTTAPVLTPEETPDPLGAATEATVEDAEPAPTATPVATTAPVAPSVQAPAPAPTATFAPVITQDPEPVFIAPTPTGPVPSDEIVVQGPVLDESESASISATGASACALAESAIDSLDRGDSARTAALLVQSSQAASQAPEPEIAARASQLANAGTDEAAAIAAIIATLNACAIHGYQV